MLAFDSRMNIQTAVWGIKTMHIRLRGKKFARKFPLLKPPFKNLDRLIVPNTPTSHREHPRFYLPTFIIQNSMPAAIEIIEAKTIIILTPPLCQQP